MNILSSLLTFIGNKLKVINLTPSITPTTGQIVNGWADRVGNVVTLRIQVKNSVAISPGGNLFAGKLNNIVPEIGASAASYAGSAGAIGQISSFGNIAVRVIGSQLTANTDVYLTFTYIVGGVLRSFIFKAYSYLQKIGGGLSESVKQHFAIYWNKIKTYSEWFGFNRGCAVTGIQGHQHNLSNSIQKYTCSTYPDGKRFNISGYRNDVLCGSKYYYKWLYNKNFQCKQCNEDSRCTLGSNTLIIRGGVA